MSGLLGARPPPRAKAGFGDDERDIIDHLPLEDLGSSKPSSPFLHPHIPRTFAASPMSEHNRLSPYPSRGPSPAPLHAYRPRRTLAQSLHHFWTDNRGVVLVGVSQLFGALMNLAARLLELEAGMHPLQILLARMSLTTALSCLYMWWTSVPDFPLGPKGLRGVLVVRGVTGFFGIYGMWYSMMYLPLAEATVITFLAPMLSGYMCDLLLKDPFTRREQLASLIALAGVVLIARPTSLFGNNNLAGPPAPESLLSPTNNPLNSTTITTIPSGAGADGPHTPLDPTPTQRLTAILVALLGVLGGACAFTAIRYVGPRAHPLITVTYFSVWSTLVSFAGLAAGPFLGLTTTGFKGLLPASAYHWFLLGGLGLCGFVMQSMVTAGIGGPKANRATAMTYTHMLFAAGFDRWVFGYRMGVVSVVGCGLIVGSALWAALGKGGGQGRRGRKEVVVSVGVDVERGRGGGGGVGRGEEVVPMLGEGQRGEEEEDDGDGGLGVRT